VRLSAGRSALSREAQILCLVAGANSLFYGDKLLTTPNAEVNEDADLFAAIGDRACPLKDSGAASRMAGPREGCNCPH
jgi:biotin synthase